MAVTAEGIPVRCWTFPGDASDQAIIRSVHDDLAGWKLQPRALGRRLRPSTASPTAPTCSAAAATTCWPRSCAQAQRRCRRRWPVPVATAPWPATWRSRRCASATACAPSASCSATTPRRPPATRQVRENLLAYLERAHRRLRRLAAAPPRRAGRRAAHRRRPWPACCGARRGACCASTRPPWRARNGSTASGCCAPPMRRSPPPTWPPPTASSTRSSAAGAT